MSPWIYLDHHATTPLDPRVAARLHNWQAINYANPGSLSHAAGRAVREEVDRSLAAIGDMLGCSAEELVITSGATESNNLALLGFCLHPRQKRRRLVSVRTEHRAVLDPLEQLTQRGFEIDWLEVYPQGHPLCGLIDLNDAQRKIDDSVAMVSVMLANNEIGVIQPLAELARLCRVRGVCLHSDATQAIGHLDVDVETLDLDLLSFSAHKFYGPKGVGGLYVREQHRRIRLLPQIFGGGQQGNRRAGTLHSPGIVAMAWALQLCQEEGIVERRRIRELRQQLWNRLDQASGGDVAMNGPPLESPHRLDRNLNCRWRRVEGQSLMLACPQLCVSSGSACTTTDPRPSHVLQAIGLSEEEARCSLRFGLGRFTTLQEIEDAADQLNRAYQELQRLV
jgi:cysteine desulfurase